MYRDINVHMIFGTFGNAYVIIVPNFISSIYFELEMNFNTTIVTICTFSHYFTIIVSKLIQILELSECET